MFRPMRRFKQQLSSEECIELLKRLPRGVLAVLGDDEYPYALPLDHYYDPQSGHLFFHCAKEGHKIDAIRRHEKVSFCVMDEGYRNEGEWALNIRSVIVFGTLREVEDRERALEMVRKLGLKYYPDAKDVDAEMRRSSARVQCLELIPAHITGKLVNES